METTKKTTFEINIPEYSWIVGNPKITIGKGNQIQVNCKLKSMTPWKNKFVRIEASRLSLADEFLQYITENSYQEMLKNLIIDAIKMGIKDFWRPQCDPSYTPDGNGITFQPGNPVATSYDYKKWIKLANDYNPKCGSRLGTQYEYAAFYGCLIKEMMETGKSAKEAWALVNYKCNEIAHMKNSVDACDAAIGREPTGCRVFMGFSDLGNTDKFLAPEGDKSVSAGANNSTFASASWSIINIYKGDPSDYYPIDPSECNNEDSHYTGWIICESDPN